MHSPSFACDQHLLRSSLDDALSDKQEELLARHLSECNSCRRDLERLAADGNTWTRVGDILQNAADGHGSVLIPEGRDGSPSFNPATRLINDYSPIDFAVDFLQPAARADSLGRLGEIDIESVIGVGGMGVVLKGFQEELNRPVAVKVLAPHLASSGAARQRFAREAQAAAVIVHPNVMPILTVDSSGKLPYLVMPFTQCESLQQRLDRDGPLNTLDVLRISLQVARGLVAAHEQGLVHRDIKPANILLEKGVERVMITDFGLARAADDASLTRSGVIAGTPQYMSPEQARGEPIDARSDLFSLGSVIYTMCTGRPPFRAETSYGILRRITDNDARPIGEVNPGVPNWLCRFVDRLLAKSADSRFPSAADAEKALQACLAHVQQPDSCPLPVEVSDSDAVGRRSRSRLWPACAAVLTFIVAGVGWTVWSPSVGDPETDPNAIRHTTPEPATGLPASQPSTPNDTADAEGADWYDTEVESLDSIESSIREIDENSYQFFDKGPFGTP